MAQYQRTQYNFVYIILSLRKMVMLSLLILGVAQRRIRPVNLRTFSLRAISSSVPSGNVLLSPENQLAVINVICFDAILRLEELLNP